MFNRYRFDNMRENYIPQVMDLITRQYYQDHQVYRALDMHVKDFQDFISPSLLKSIQNPLSFVMIDQKLKRIVGVKIIKDFSLLRYNPDQYDHPKQQFKHNLDCGVLQQHLKKGYKPGYACTEELCGVEPQLSLKDQIFVTQQLVTEHIRVMYFNGYQIDISPIYIQQNCEITKSITGYVQNKWDLQKIKFNGQNIFSGVHDGASCYIMEIKETDIQQMFGNEIADCKKQYEQSLMLKSQKLQKIQGKMNRLNNSKMFLLNPKL